MRDDQFFKYSRLLQISKVGLGSQGESWPLSVSIYFCYKDQNMQIPCILACVGQLVCLLDSYTSLFANELKKGKTLASNPSAVLPLVKINMQDLPFGLLELGLLRILDELGKNPEKTSGTYLFRFFLFGGFRALLPFQYAFEHNFTIFIFREAFQNYQSERMICSQKVVAQLSVFTRVLMKLLVDSKETVAFDY